MAAIYSWTSDQQPDNYQSTLRPLPEPKEDADRPANRRADEAVDEERTDRLVDMGFDPDGLRGVDLLSLEVALFCLDRPHRMFTPEQILDETTETDWHSIRALLAAERPVNPVQRIRQVCEFLSQQRGIGVSVLLDDQYEYGFGFLWTPGQKPPATPHRFESMLGRETLIQATAAIQAHGRRDRQLLEEQQQRTQEAMARMAELQQRYFENNSRCLGISNHV